MIPIAVTYTTGAKVAAFLQVPAFTASTTPTLASVESWINWVEDYMDRYTNHAWRSVTVTNEYHDIKKFRWDWEAGVSIKLMHSNVKTFSAASGDKLEIWDGNNNVDWIVNRVEGRDNDYWCMYEDGVIMLRLFYQFFRRFAIRVTYRYGETVVPGDIEQAATNLASAKVLENEARSTLTPAGETQFLTYYDRITKWEKKAHEILDLRQKMTVIGWG